MSEAFLADVGDQLVGELAVVGDVLAPAGRVHLVDADRSVVRIRGGAPLHPDVVAPDMFGVDHDRTGAWRDLMGAFHRIGLHDPFVVGVEQLVFVYRSACDSGDEQFPDAGRADFPHRMRPPVPSIEIADHAHGMGVRRPYGERGADQLFAGLALIGSQRIVVAQYVRAERLPEAFVPSLAEQVGVHVADGGQITVWIVGDHDAAVLVFGADAVIGHAMAGVRRDGGNQRHENAVVLVHREGPSLLRDDRHAFRHGAQHANRDDVLVPVGSEVPAQHLVRVVVSAVAHRVQSVLRHGRGDDIFIDLRICSHGKSVSTKWRKMASCRVLFCLFGRFSASPALVEQ